MGTRLAWVLALGLALAGCGGDSEGARCSSNDDCDDDHVCALLATCAGGDCPGICGRPCATDEDCEAGERCVEDTPGGGEICRDSRSLDDL